LAYRYVPFESPSAVRDPSAEARPLLLENRAAQPLAALPVREPMAPPQGELFGPRSWVPPAGAQPRGGGKAPKRSAPPMPYRVAGQVTHDDGMRVVLAKGDRVYLVREGETLEDGYRVESIRPDAVVLVYLPLALRERLEVSGTRLSLDAPRAQLRFDGPREVRAGSPFTVALKVTATKAVQAAPLELTFDAKLLQAMSVRPGKLFADGRLSYRVNPEGSIFVGAYGTLSDVADADFLFVTFKPVASGAAELKVVSVMTQGPVGRLVAIEPPPAFRAAIVQ
jgi:hypothetical protein